MLTFSVSTEVEGLRTQQQPMATTAGSGGGEVTFEGKIHVENIMSTNHQMT